MTTATPFDMIVFDWDGTAVPDRQAPIGELKAALEQVLKEGVACAIVTGTNLDNILGQGIGTLSSLAKQGLHVCTNRGSEVFDFDPEGKPRLVYRRNATASENRALDDAAIELHARIAAHGMRTEIVFNRLNRRKVDLIPEPEWSAPKKAQFRELLAAVQARLRAAGLAGGISALLEQAKELAKTSGLADPKVTSDIKHIEIGLTDKGDAASWIARKITGPDRIPPSRVAVLGDELGSLGDLPGSDALMRIPELRDASFFSVGVEPEGVPAWVHFLGGGPARFIEFLVEQSRMRREQRNATELVPCTEQSWILEQEGFDASRERLMETLFAISNGNLGVRGASDLPIPAAQADLFVAGLYDRRVPTQAYSESELFDSSDASQTAEAEIVPLPFPFRFCAQLDRESIHAGNVNRVEHRRCLDFRKGAYFEQNLIEAREGQRVEISTVRLCSHVDAHLLIQRIRLRSVNFSAQVDIDFSMLPEELEVRYPHIRPVTPSPFGRDSNLTELQAFETLGSGDFICIASRLWVNGRELRSPRIVTDLAPGETLSIERRISIFWSREMRVAEGEAVRHSKAQAKSQATAIGQPVESHLQDWNRFWSGTDVAFPLAPGPTDALRFNLYHLKSSAALVPETSIPAKALTGRAYEGHVFWDTEVFILPFFLYTAPEIARRLLLYRHKTLPGARARASGMGYRGACFAWESTVTGRDVTPSSISISGRDLKIPIFTGTQQLHVTADVAWAVVKYWDATLDHDFICDYGMEILVETARFWVSRITPSGRSYHLKEIVGPDEYHHGVTDNAFTNWMVRFNLQSAIRAVRWCAAERPRRLDELSSKLMLRPNETTDWQEAAGRLFVPAPGKDGVIEQFEGFFSLKPARLSGSEKNRAPISRLFDWDQINQTRIVKQADVLMIPFLFPEELPLSVIRANYDYYEPITDHGSSLSPCVHAAIAARAGKWDDALRYWRESLYFDLHDTMSNSQLGIHAAALGGTWQALVFHLFGIRPSGTGFLVDPEVARPLPSEWDGLELKLQYQGRLSAWVLASGRLTERKKEAA